MAKVNTDLIKKVINDLYSKKYNSKIEVKRLTKRKFNYKDALVAMTDFVDDKNKIPIVKLSGNLNWRVYADKEEEGSPFFIIDNGDDILYIGEDAPQLPGSCFKVGVYPCGNTDSIGFFILLKDEYEDAFPEESQIYNDDLREYSVAGLEAIFELNGFKLTNEEENTFSLYHKVNENGLTLEDALSNGDFNSHLITANEDNLNKIKDLLINQLNMTYSKDLEVF
jgi:hypothetical protein